MLSKDDRLQIKHICEVLDKEAEVKEEEAKEFRRVRNELFGHLFGKGSFECPLKKSNYDAICPKCTNAIPFITEGWKCGGSSEAINFYTFPHGAEEEITNKVKFKTTGCKEWKKKSHSTACGCAGIMWCECGYNEEYCYSGQEKCPYCGRQLQHKKYKPFDFNLEQIKSKEK